MSTFSIVGIILLCVVVTGGAVVKTVLVKRREKMEGCHGYVHRHEAETSETDDWKNI